MAGFITLDESSSGCGLLTRGKICLSIILSQVLLTSTTIRHNSLDSNRQLSSAADYKSQSSASARLVTRPLRTTKGSSRSRLERRPSLDLLFVACSLSADAQGRPKIL